MNRTTLVFGALLVSACAEPAPETARGAPDSAPNTSAPHAAPDTSAPATHAYPIDVPADWDVSRLPPAAALLRIGACPFECCQYGEWWSDSATTVYRTARDTRDVAFILPSRTPVTADNGFIRVTSLARVVFSDTMTAEEIGVPDVTLTPADTLYLVEPIGEGAFRVWLDGRELELPGIWESYYPGTSARREGEYAREWWAHVRTADGREGWVWMDRTKAPMWGADACGGPHPLPA